jgi:predicted nucleic acid-binding protein
MKVANERPMLAVDANVVAYLLIEGEHSKAARAIWVADPDWRLPALWHHEFLNVLATLGRTRNVARSELVETWRTAHALLANADHEIDGESALVIALDHRLSAYDAQYVAVARALKTHLVTEDQKLRRALPDETSSLADRLSTLTPPHPLQ